MNNEPDYDNLYFEEKKMIKVGQIWQNPQNKTDTIAITSIDKRAGRKQSDWLFSYIWNDGETVCADDDFFIKRSRKLIAEYPTWQEAVNSKEFKTENEE